MTRRARIALLAIAALVLVPGVVAGSIGPSGVPAGNSSIEVVDVQPAAPVAVRVKSPVPSVPRALPEATVVVMVVAALCRGLRRRSMRGLPFRLGDVGDRWRALLFGAPPALL